MVSSPISEMMSVLRMLQKSTLPFQLREGSKTTPRLNCLDFSGRRSGFE